MKEFSRTKEFFFFANIKLGSSVGNVIDPYLISQTRSWVAEAADERSSCVHSC